MLLLNPTRIMVFFRKFAFFQYHLTNMITPLSSTGHSFIFTLSELRLQKDFFLEILIKVKAS